MISVLIVDDEKDILDIFRDVFESRGCSVITASNGIEALEIIKNIEINVVVTDINMPVMNGLKLLSAIENRKGKKPYVITMSGAGNSDFSERQMTAAGAAGFVTKPINLRQIKEIVDSYILMLDESEAA